MLAGPKRAGSAPMSRPGRTGPSRTVGAAYKGATCFRQSGRARRVRAPETILRFPPGGFSGRFPRLKPPWNSGCQLFFQSGSPGRDPAGFGLGHHAATESFETAYLVRIQLVSRCFSQDCRSFVTGQELRDRGCPIHRFQYTGRVTGSRTLSNCNLTVFRVDRILAPTEWLK